MAEIPDVRYARSGGVAVAYQVLGDGPQDLVFLPPLSNLYSLWLRETFVAGARRLAETVRLILVNTRGMGLSDRPRGLTIESRMDDALTAMDAVGSSKANLLGWAETSTTCIVFAATYPERLERLEGFARELNPQWADDAEYLEWFVWTHRLSSSPESYVEFRRIVHETNVTDVLPAIRVLEAHHAAVRRELSRFGGTELDTAGDGFFATFGGPARAIACALAIESAVASLGLSIRIGIHTGECERVGEKLAGLAVSVGARVSASAEPGQVLVSGTVRDLVAGSGFAFEDRGEHELKGVPGTWRLLRVVASSG